MKLIRTPMALAAICLCLIGCAGPRLTPSAQPVCHALPNDLALIAPPEIKPLVLDLTDQTLAGLTKRYVRALGAYRDVMAAYTAARALSGRADEIYQKIRRLHPAECGGIGGDE